MWSQIETVMLPFIAALFTTVYTHTGILTVNIIVMVFWKLIYLEIDVTDL